jgi:hypothetical protein
MKFHDLAREFAKTTAFAEIQRQAAALFKSLPKVQVIEPGRFANLTDDLPHTVFRCAACGTKVGSHHPQPQPGKRTWRFRHGEPFTCDTHGQLQDPGFDEWHEKWTRRGKPDRLNLELKPLK